MSDIGDGSWMRCLLSRGPRRIPLGLCGFRNLICEYLTVYKSYENESEIFEISSFWTSISDTYMSIFEKWIFDDMCLDPLRISVLESYRGILDKSISNLRIQTSVSREAKREYMRRLDCNKDLCITDIDEIHYLLSQPQ